MARRNGNHARARVSIEREREREREGGERDITQLAMMDSL